MDKNPSMDVQQVQAAVDGAAGRHWLLFLMEGAVLGVLGLLAILVPRVASIATTLIIGWILLLSGVVGLGATVRARHAPGFSWSLVSAIVALVAGALLLGWPVQGTFSVTAVVIAFLLLEGIVSVMYALEHRKGLSGRWGWMLASGIVDLVLGGILFAGLPGTAVWVLGFLVGINMIFGGWALIAMALHARSRARVNARRQGLGTSVGNKM
jgi:uncharacterized membrane protein HdeD (DUF308 family)